MITTTSLAKLGVTRRRGKLLEHKEGRYGSHCRGPGLSQVIIPVVIIFIIGSIRHLRTKIIILPPSSSLPSSFCFSSTAGQLKHHLGKVGRSRVSLTLGRPTLRSWETSVPSPNPVTWSLFITILETLSLSINNLGDNLNDNLSENEVLENLKVLCELKFEV